MQEAGSAEPTVGGNSDKSGKEKQEKKPRTDAQELKALLSKSASKLTEAKGWGQKLVDNGTLLVSSLVSALQLDCESGRARLCESTWRT